MSGSPGSSRDQRLGGGVDAAGEPLQGRPERRLPAAVRRVRALAGPAQHAVVTAPRGPVADPDLGVRVAGRLLGDRGERDDVEAAVRGRLRRGDEAVEEQVAERLVVAVELAVARDDEHRCAPVVQRAPEARRDALAREAVRVGRHRRLEGDRRRQVGVVEQHRDVAPAAHVDAVRLAVVQVVRLGLPRREDRRLDARLGHEAQRREVDRRLREPHRPRRPPEAVLEVAQAPQDLGPAVVERRERQDRVVEGLGDARAAGRTAPRRSDEANAASTSGAASAR